MNIDSLKCRQQHCIILQNDMEIKRMLKLHFIHGSKNNKNTSEVIMKLNNVATNALICIFKKVTKISY